VQNKLLSFICQKSNISYILFDTNFQIIQSFNNNADKGEDIRHSLYELVGFESMILAKQNIEIPMILRNDNYYDLFIEPFEEQEQTSFIAYLQQRSKESEHYANALQQINKKTLIYDTSEEKKDTQYYQEIKKNLMHIHVDLDGRITMINDAVSYFFNLESSAILGKHFSEFFIPQNENKAQKYTIFTAKNSFSKRIFFHANIIPLKNKNGVIYENIIIAQDISYLKEVKTELEYVQEHDTLTGLPNRHYLLKEIDARVQEEQKVMITLVDILDFSTINEDYGSHAGDMYLKHLVAIIQNTLETKDILSRLFADTFVILYEANKNREYVDILLQKVQESLKNNPLLYTQDDKIYADIAFLTQEIPTNAENAKELISQTEQKLQKLKTAKKLSL
jgi:diguanylate cyclase (GGDEF)-like protein